MKKEVLVNEMLVLKKVLFLLGVILCLCSNLSVRAELSETPSSSWWPGARIRQNSWNNNLEQNLIGTTMQIHSMSHHKEPGHSVVWNLNIGNRVQCKIYNPTSGWRIATPTSHTGGRHHGMPSFWVPPYATYDLKAEIIGFTEANTNIRFTCSDSDGNVIMTTTYNETGPGWAATNTTTWGITLHFQVATFFMANPIVPQPAPLELWVGDPTSLVTSDMTATWGITTSNLIPPMGEISLVTPVPNYLTLDGTTFSGIGTMWMDIEVRDDHSLSTASAYELDSGFTPVSREVRVKTLLSPVLQATFHENARDMAGNFIPSIPPLVYNPTGSNPTGEEGWVNQPLNIILSPEGIVGNFDAVLRHPTAPPAIATDAPASYMNYLTESTSTLGTNFTGVLTDVAAATSPLSGSVSTIVKVDLTPPIANANYTGGFHFAEDSTDDLSGMSALYPTQIAFTTPSPDMTPPVTGWEDMDSHTMTATGNYDVWIWATDKAGNTDVKKVFPDLFIGGDVTIVKNTDAGALLHDKACPNANSMTVSGTCLSCSVGANAEIEERSALTYKLILTNTDSTDSATGTFTDYLPLGSVVSTIPIATPAAAVSGLDFQLETVAPYAGQYKVTGNYTLAAGEQVEIEILCKAPAFDKVILENNIIRNQATVTWEIDTRNGNNESNYALHELTEKPGVQTLFTKVGADDITQGIAGVEFVLYRWDGALAPTTEEQNHIVDYSVLVDNTLPGGNWIRVTYDAEEALALTDIFVSSASPVGEVDLGTLPEGVYTLIETKASGGYALPVGQWILTIDPSKDDSGADDWKIEFTGKSSSIAPPAAIRDENVPNDPTYKIVNAEPFLIGLSGLGGTTGMLLVGFVLMAIAGNTYFVWRYKCRNK